MVIPNQNIKVKFWKSYFIKRVIKYDGDSKMYIYQITNLINNKIYIGQTNNIKKRWSNHKCGNNSNMIIARAIKKYGVENFKFEILYRNLSLEEANIKEIQLIKEKNSRVPNGYNIASGGDRIDGYSRYGADNSNAHLSEEEAQYILNNRNIPMYILYEDFKDKISYNQFRKIYHHQTYKNLKTNVEEYPFNFDFSNQFCKHGLEYDEVLDIRERYEKGEYWRDVFEDYKNIYTNEWSFWKAYNGLTYKLVRPEVFTNEAKRKHSSYSKSGNLNGRAKLKEEDVLTIRKLNNDGISNVEIYKLYPQVSSKTIRDIINKKTWKNLL